jgi:glycosyltransferase involved in cell wall biosynthesis
MKILFDYQIFLLQKYGGISTYYSNLIEGINKHSSLAKIIAPVYISEIIEDKNKIGKKISRIPKFSTKILTRLDDLLFEFFARKIKPQIIHHTYYNKIYNFNNIKKITTVYDLIHEKFYNKSNMKINSIKKSDKIICISNHTKNELLNYYNLKEENTDVVYLASKFSGNVKSKKEKNIDPYILFVGERSKYKNFTNFIKSISRSKLLKNKIKIVCFGYYPFSKVELELFNSEGIANENISFVSGDDELLKKLYINSMALVYPSHYEGFGLPILEAMSLGCPVACSKTSSIPEVAGDAANYFDPKDIENMTNSIEDIVFSNEKRQLLINKGYIQNKKFSWGSCVSDTLEVYKSVL